MKPITTSLWFDTQAEEAARFYVSLFPNSKLGVISRYPENFPQDRAGQVLTVEFELNGAPFSGLNGGPQFKFSEAISLRIEVEDQAELDRYWDALIADGGEESQCGWLKDRFGLSWQVVPRQLGELMSSGDAAVAGRVGQAMLKMRKLDVAALEAAAAG